MSTENLTVTDQLLDSIRDRIAAGDDESGRDSMAKVAWAQAVSAKSRVDQSVSVIRDRHARLASESARAVDHAARDRVYRSAVTDYANCLAAIERDRLVALKQLSDAIRVLVAGGYVANVESFSDVGVA